MKRRSFFARVLGVVAAGAVVPESLNAVLVPTQKVVVSQKFLMEVQFNADRFIAGVKEAIRQSEGLAEAIRSAKMKLDEKQR